MALEAQSQELTHFRKKTMSEAACDVLSGSYRRAIKGPSQELIVFHTFCKGKPSY